MNRSCSGARPSSIVHAAMMAALLFQPAAEAGVSDTVFRLRAVGGQGAAVYELSLADTGWGAAELAAGAAFEVRDVALQDPLTHAAIARLERLNLYVKGDPVIAMSFVIAAAKEPIVMEIESGLLTFEPAPCAQLALSGALTLRDGEEDGATLLGRSGPDRNRVFWATYNGDPFNPTSFASLISQLRVTPGRRVSSIDDRYPYAGDQACDEPIESMQLLASFRLSAFDSASGAALFEVYEQEYPHGDMNCDGRVDFADIDGFVLLLCDRPQYRESFPNCCGSWTGDMNRDGQVDFDDIDGFIECLNSDQCS